MRKFAFRLELDLDAFVALGALAEIVSAFHGILK